MDEILTPEHWLELQGRIRQQYPELTDADLQYHEAFEQDLMTMIKYSLRKTKKLMQGISVVSHHLSPLHNYLRYEKSRQIRQKIKQ